MIAPEIEAKLRSSVISLRTSDGRVGTIWVAKDNGIAVSAVRLVRWFAEGRMSSTGGELEIMAKAVHLDLALQIAFLAPTFRIALPALTLGDDRGAKVGQPVFAIGAGLAAVGGTIASIASDSYELNATIGPELLGAPVIDEQGMVIGAIADTEGRPRMVPISRLVIALAELGGEPAELFDRLPYRCAGCGAMFGRSDGRCSGCGVPPRFGADEPLDLALANDARLLGSLLVRLGHDPSACRVAPDRWQLDEVSLGLDAGVLRIGITVQDAPDRHHEAAYRFLLTYADQASDHLAIGIRGGRIELQSIEPLVLLGERELGARIQQMRDGAFRLRQTLPKALSGDVPQGVPVLMGEPLALELDAADATPLELDVADATPLELDVADATPLELDVADAVPLEPDAVEALPEDDDMPLDLGDDLALP